jgi:DNA-binding LacI/PurR family transcriptional regulator
MGAEHRVTAADIARSLGVSRATVGFALNDTPGQTISPATRERVLAEARRLGYRPHSAARALASGRSRIVLLVLPDWPLDFTLRRNIEEASLALDEAGYTLITYTPHPTGQAQPLWEVLDPDAVVSMTPLSDARIAAIRAAGVRHIIPDPDRVIAQEYREDGPALQVRHLVERGHARIAFAGSADPRIADLVRLRGARAAEAAAEAGAELGTPRDLALEGAGATAAVAAWRAEGVSAVAAYNDDVAVAVIGAALRGGLRVPDDLAVIGHDDTPLASVVQPRLSTIRLDNAGLGRYLAALTLRVIEGRAAPVRPPGTQVDLVVRDST